MKKIFIYFNNNHTLVNLDDVTRIKPTNYGNGLVIYVKGDPLSVVFSTKQERDDAMNLIITKLTQDAEVININNTMRDI